MQKNLPSYYQFRPWPKSHHAWAFWVVPLFVAAFLISDYFKSFPEFRHGSMVLSSGIPRFEPVPQQGSVLMEWIRFSPYCQSGQISSDFVAGQCEVYVGSLVRSSALSFAPFLILILALVFLRKRVKSFWSRVNHTLKNNPPWGQGVVTESTRYDSDSVFSRRFGFQLGMLKLESGRMEEVLLPREHPTPLIGQKFWIYTVGEAGGKERKVGVLNLPQMTVFSGGS